MDYVTKVANSGKQNTPLTVKPTSGTSSHGSGLYVSNNGTLQSRNTLYSNKSLASAKSSKNRFSPSSRSRFRTLSTHSRASEIMETKMEMKKEINLTYATSLLTGIVIGSGIFVSPVSITAHCGSIGLSLVVWVVSGLLTIGVALSYSELAGMMPHAGGEYAYFKQTIGHLPAFLTAWAQLIVINPCFYAVLALTTTNYIFKPLFVDCDMPASATNIFSVWIIVSVVALNCAYVKYVARVQTVLSAVKIIALIIIICAGFIEISKGNTHKLQAPFEGSNWDPGSIAVAVYTGIFVYGGWQYIFLLIEEVQDAAKIIPRAVAISMSVVTLLYFCTNLSYFTILTPEEMIQSPAVAVSFAEATLGKFSLAIPVFVASSTIGSLNGSILGGSRTYFAASRDGLFPGMLSLIHTHYLTPWPAVWSTCIISVLYCVVGDPILLIEYLGFIASLNLVVSLLCLHYLRWTQPHRARPIKIPSVITSSCTVIMLFMLLFGLVKQPYQNGIGLLFVLSGIPVYFICVKWKGKPEGYDRLSRSLTVMLQKVLLLVPPET